MEASTLNHQRNEHFQVYLQASEKACLFADPIAFALRKTLGSDNLHPLYLLSKATQFVAEQTNCHDFVQLVHKISVAVIFALQSITMAYIVSVYAFNATVGAAIFASLLMVSIKVQDMTIFSSIAEDVPTVEAQKDIEEGLPIVGAEESIRNPKITNAQERMEVLKKIRHFVQNELSFAARVGLTAVAVPPGFAVGYVLHLAAPYIACTAQFLAVLYVAVNAVKNYRTPLTRLR